MPADVPRRHHRSQMKTTSANMGTITLVLTAHICNSKKMSYHHYPTLRLVTKMGFHKPHRKQVAFNPPPSKVVNHQLGKPIIMKVTATKIMVMSTQQPQARQGTTKRAKEEKAATLVTRYTATPREGMEAEFYYLADIWGKHMCKVTLPLKNVPPPPLKDTDQRGECCEKIFTFPSACQGQITSTTKFSDVPQPQVPNSIQPRNPFLESSLAGQLWVEFLNKFFSRLCRASTVISRSEVVVVVDDMTTSNGPLSKAGAFLKCQSTEVEVISFF
jgi:hypothetical protein